MHDDPTPPATDVPDADFADLRDRLRQARWPELETVDADLAFPRLAVEDADSGSSAGSTTEPRTDGSALAPPE